MCSDRVWKHRHRPDDQVQTHLRRRRRRCDGRYRSGIGRAGPSGADGCRHDQRRHRWSRGLDVFGDIDLVFDATSAGAHARHNEVLQPTANRSSISLQRRSVRTWFHRSISRNTSERPTSTWSPAVVRPPCRSSPPCTRSRPSSTGRSCRRSRRSRPDPEPARTSTSSPRRPRRRSRTLVVLRWARRSSC